MEPAFKVERIASSRADEAVGVLAEAFRDYPAMRFFLAGAGTRYEEHLRALMGFFTTARFLRGDEVLGVSVDREIAAVAYLVRPGTATPTELAERREALWAELGGDARERYEAFGRATASFSWPAEPSHHLALIGVRRRHAGRGLARLLMDAAHETSRRDPVSRGVSLTTEDPGNLPIYEHFGYRRLGHARLPGLETWGMFRDDDDAGA